MYFGTWKAVQRIRDALPVAKTNFLRAFGQRVRAARTKAGLTQQEAAIRARMEQRTWSLMENGRRAITLRTLPRVAAAIGVPASGLIPDQLDA
jgi:transcriptional regulator with XRE-family HTH domain